MATLASEEELEYLWRPKRTLRDWGETSYNIVRNWTPHNKKLAPPSSSPNNSKVPVTKLPPAKKLPSGTKAGGAKQGEVSTSYRLRRSSRRQQSAQRSESSWYIPDDVTARNRGSVSFRSLKQNHHNGSGPLDDEIDNNEQIHGDAHSSSMSSSESPNGAHLSLNHISNSPNGQLHSQKSIAHARVASLGDGNYTYSSDMYEREEQGAPVQRPDNEVVDGGSEGAGVGGMVDGEEISDADPMDCEDNNMDVDALLQPITKTTAGLGTQPISSSKARCREGVAGKRRRSSTKPKKSRKRVKDKSSGDDNESVIKVKLCQPEGTVTQMDEELNELASCPAASYPTLDDLIKEATSGPGCGVRQNALDSHQWDGTPEEKLSMIEYLRNATALEERLREDKAKHSHLQKDMLKSLHRSSGEYSEAVVKAKGTKRRREKIPKHNHLQKEMRGILKTLQKSSGEYREALAKAKQGKQRQEILDVEHQIAEVGILLQSGSPN